MLPLVKTHIPDKEILMPELEKVLYSGYIAQGDLVENFERKFESFIGAGHTLSLNSGTAALHIALILAGVGEGDEVISTPLTAEPTNVAIKMVGAKIRWADIDPNTGGICPRSIENNINHNTKAIIFVDYAGIPSNIDEIKKISDTYKLPVIEDAAHALGARFKNRMLGTHFPFTVFSFQAIKHLTTIDGGALQIQDSKLYEVGKKIRWFGLDKGVSRLDNDITYQGYKYHMNNVNACVGLVQLQNIDKIISKYIENGRYFDEKLKGIEGVSLLKYYEGSEPSYWLYTLKVKNRDRLIEKLSANNIMASELHKRNDFHTYLNDFPSELPNLDKFYAEMLHIPCGWWVTKKDCDKIISLMKEGW
jgi:dTDP-4-amino-4,6-dideoxygalactose transaminase